MTREAKELNHLRDALKRIAMLRPAGDVEQCFGSRKLVEQMERIALDALLSSPPTP